MMNVTFAIVTVTPSVREPEAELPIVEGVEAREDGSRNRDLV
jgi:hypothetical protein